ncbi:MAG: archaetidylserine decarboxylase [Bacilli bacterium]
MKRLYPGRLALGLLPRRLLTQTAGHFLRSSASKAFIPLYMLVYGIADSQVERPWRTYGSLAEFFARKLPPGSRTFSVQDDDIVSPVDGVIVELGRVDAGRAVQIKGISYSLAALLADVDANLFEHGTHVVIYLSPRNYHRIHAPVAAVVRRIIHVPGTLYPVNRLGTTQIPSLYTKNERTISWFSRGGDMFALVKVGSTIVGSVRLSPHLQCRTVQQRGRGPARMILPREIAVAQGEELAWFEFGSTVVMVFREGQVELDVAKGDMVKALQPIGKWRTRQ